MNSPEFILLSDALALLAKKDRDGNPKPCTVRFCTLDTKRNTGGEMMEVKAYLPHNRINSKQYRKAMRNICVIGKAHPVAVHIYLITSINGKEVL